MNIEGSRLVLCDNVLQDFEEWRKMNEKRMHVIYAAT
jgi:hypothetical protein